MGGRPGSKDHWAQDAAVWAEWGVDWVKMDWCNSQGEDVQSTYAAMSHALNASGRHFHFNMCEWGLENPWEWGNDVAQSWRMGGDHTGIWSSTVQVVKNTAVIPANYSGRPFGWNDMVRACVCSCVCQSIHLRIAEDSARARVRAYRSQQHPSPPPQTSGTWMTRTSLGS